MREKDSVFENFFFDCCFQVECVQQSADYSARISWKSFTPETVRNRSLFENVVLIVVSRLGVFNNQLTSLPESLGKLSQLQELEKDFKKKCCSDCCLQLVGEQQSADESAGIARKSVTTAKVRNRFL